MKYVFFAAVLLFSTAGIAQTGNGFGLKGGLNYGSTGEIMDDLNTISEGPDDKVGYHVGLYAKADLGLIYVRPELMYTKLNSEYSQGDFEVQKLDLPILVGVNILGPLHVFAGPSLQYILDTEFEGFDIDDAEEDFTIGAQFGVGVDLGRLGLDVRYERGLTENEAEFGGVTGARLDTRPEQIIVGLSVGF
jgi:hypothetical protein